MSYQTSMEKYPQADTGVSILSYTLVRPRQWILIPTRTSVPHLKCELIDTSGQLIMVSLCLINPSYDAPSVLSRETISNANASRGRTGAAPTTWCYSNAKETSLRGKPSSHSSDSKTPHDTSRTFKARHVFISILLHSQNSASMSSTIEYYFKPCATTQKQHPLTLSALTVGCIETVAKYHARWTWYND
jgi:hypothetical protein